MFLYLLVSEALLGDKSSLLSLFLFFVSEVSSSLVSLSLFLSSHHSHPFLPFSNFHHPRLRRGFYLLLFFRDDRLTDLTFGPTLLASRHFLYLYSVLTGSSDVETRHVVDIRLVK